MHLFGHTHSTKTQAKVLNFTSNFNVADDIINNSLGPTFFFLVHSPGPSIKAKHFRILQNQKKKKAENKKKKNH